MICNSSIKLLFVHLADWNHLWLIFFLFLPLLIQQEVLDVEVDCQHIFKRQVMVWWRCRQINNMWNYRRSTIVNLSHVPKKMKISFHIFYTSMKNWIYDKIYCSNNIVPNFMWVLMGKYNLRERESWNIMILYVALTINLYLARVIKQDNKLHFRMLLNFIQEILHIH